MNGLYRTTAQHDEVINGERPADSANSATRDYFVSGASATAILRTCAVYDCPRLSAADGTRSPRPN